jgi:hypothetical protein
METDGTVRSRGCFGRPMRKGLAVLGGEMEFTVEIGAEERHRLHTKFDQVFGQVKVEVDGKNVAQDWRSFSLHRTRRYEFVVGTKESHDVVIELTRKGVVGGFRSQTCQVFVDGESVGAYVGTVTGKTRKAA